MDPRLASWLCNSKYIYIYIYLKLLLDSYKYKEDF